MRFLLYGSLLLLLLAGCGDNSEPVSLSDSSENAPVTVTVTVTVTDTVAIEAETERLNGWFDEQFEQQLDFSPQFKTRLGIKSDYDLLDDYSERAMDRLLEWRQASVATMREDFDYDSLNEDGKLSYDMWVYAMEQVERGLPYRFHSYIFGRGGPHAFIPNFLINYHVVDTAEDMDAYISRLQEIDRVFAELLDIANRSSADGIRQPAFAYDFAIAEIGRVTSGAPFSTDDTSPNSPLWTDILGKVDGLSENDIIDAEQANNYRLMAQEILTGEVMTAYQNILDWLQQDKTRASETARGVWSLNDGENYYNYRLQLMTTVDLTADEIHNIGLSEVERLREEMDAIKESVGFEGSLQDFFAFMREDEQFYFPNSEQGRQDYLDLNNEYLGTITARLPEFFGRLPKAELEVKRVESFREQAGAAQHYAPGTPDGSRPGVFYSHMLDMATLPIFQVEDVAYHEGLPGHHMQISIQQELTDVPRFRTQYRSTAYTEGWGLYAEWLAKEMGGFQDPYSDFGRLGGEIWRAIRLVVDTGIHAKRWTEEEAVQYFMENSPAPEGAVRSEIQRYITGAGQATAYKIGMLKFQEVRANAEAVLGNEFDIREFHDIVLGAGALPLPLMEMRVERWVSDKQSAIN